MVKSNLSGAWERFESLLAEASNAAEALIERTMLAHNLNPDVPADRLLYLTAVELEARSRLH